MIQVLTTTPKEIDERWLARSIVSAVLRELKNRAGFDDWLDSMDRDTQTELLSTLDQEAFETLSIALEY